MAMLLNKIGQTAAWLTFDCYGTLVDWEAGIREVLGRLSGRSGAELAELTAAYVRIEAEVEAGGYQAYREVQAETLVRLAEESGFVVPADQRHVLAERLPHWPAFADTAEALRRLKTKYRLAVLSNIDRAMLAETVQQFGVRFDLLVTAEDVRSYKPAPGHFTRMFERTGARPERVLHVAQSIFHDGRPASELGLAFAWINRYGQGRPADVPMVGEFATLAALAEGLGV